MNNFSPSEKVYTLTEASKILHYCRETTRQLVKDLAGVYRTPSRGAHYRIPAASLEALRQKLTVSRENV